MFRGLAELGAFSLLRDWVVSPERALPAPWAELTPAVLWTLCSHRTPALGKALVDTDQNPV